MYNGIPLVLYIGHKSLTNRNAHPAHPRRPPGFESMAGRQNATAATMILDFLWKYMHINNRYY